MSSREEAICLSRLDDSQVLLGTTVRGARLKRLFEERDILAVYWKSLTAIDEFCWFRLHENVVYVCRTASTEELQYEVCWFSKEVFDEHVSTQRGLYVAALFLYMKASRGEIPCSMAIVQTFNDVVRITGFDPREYPKLGHC